MLRRITASAPARRLTLAAIELSRAVSRLASVLRTAALFRGPNLPVCHWSVTLKHPERIRCGVGVVIGPRSTLGAAGGIDLGDHVRISEGVLVETAGLDFTKPAPYPHIMRPIRIESGAWIGARAIILAGVTIGRDAVIGAGAIVSRDVLPESVVVGQQPNVRGRASGDTGAGVRKLS